MAGITTSVASGSVISKETFLQIKATGLTSVDETAYDANATPTMPELRHYLTAELAGQDTLRSPVFAVNHDGEWAWDNVLFPAAGTWTLHIRLDADDSSAYSESLVVI